MRFSNDIQALIAGFRRRNCKNLAGWQCKLLVVEGIFDDSIIAGIRNPDDRIANFDAFRLAETIRPAAGGAGGAGDRKQANYRGSGNRRQTTFRDMK